MRAALRVSVDEAAGRAAELAVWRGLSAHVVELLTRLSEVRAELVSKQGLASLNKPERA